MRRHRLEKINLLNRLREEGSSEADLPSTVQVVAELQLAKGRAAILEIEHRSIGLNQLVQDDVFWIDYCLTPRTRSAHYGCFMDDWPPHRTVEMGPIFALPPGHRLLVRNGGGGHSSMICQLDAKEVFKWLPCGFDLTDRRLEACLSIAAESVRVSLMRMSHELRHPKRGSRELCDAIMAQLAIELARYIGAFSEVAEKGGLAPWRLRAIDKRIAKAGDPPTLADLAELCKLSPRQLTRGFRTSRGCSIGNYMAQRRIEAAKRRLAAGESVQMVARSMGFSSHSNFTCAFRRATGASPSQFRNYFAHASESGANDRAM